MTERTGWMPALRWVLFAALLVNAVTLTVYFRVQEYRLKYRISRLQGELDQERERTRELARELLRTAQQGRIDDRLREFRLELQERRE
jgi:cell division protein FtsL